MQRDLTALTSAVLQQSLAVTRGLASSSWGRPEDPVTRAPSWQPTAPNRCLEPKDPPSRTVRAQQLLLWAVPMALLSPSLRAHAACLHPAQPLRAHGQYYCSVVPSQPQLQPDAMSSSLQTTQAASPSLLVPVFAKQKEHANQQTGFFGYPPCVPCTPGLCPKLLAPKDSLPPPSSWPLAPLHLAQPELEILPQVTIRFHQPHPPHTSRVRGSSLRIPVSGQ